MEIAMLFVAMAFTVPKTCVVYAKMTKADTRQEVVVLACPAAPACISRLEEPTCLLVLTNAHPPTLTTYHYKHHHIQNDHVLIDGGFQAVRLPWSSRRSIDGRQAFASIVIIIPPLAWMCATPACLPPRPWQHLTPLPSSPHSCPTPTCHHRPASSLPLPPPTTHPTGLLFDQEGAHEGGQGTRKPASTKPTPTHTQCRAPS